VGPALYDPASLLRDCYYTHDESLITDCLARFANHSPELTGIPPKTLTWWLDACAIQRQLKAIGIFARLHLRDGKSSHLGYIVPTLGRLTVLTKLYPELNRLNTLLSAWSSAARQLEILNRENPS
jgi:aminoglycoside/choline kinase family phosphotransferase